MVLIIYKMIMKRLEESYVKVLLYSFVMKSSLQKLVLLMLLLKE